MHIYAVSSNWTTVHSTGAFDDGAGPITDGMVGMLTNADYHIVPESVGMRREAPPNPAAMDALLAQLVHPVPQHAPFLREQPRLLYKYPHDL